jgi:hypothetical protein
MIHTSGLRHGAWPPARTSRLERRPDATEDLQDGYARRDRTLPTRRMSAGPRRGSPVADASLPGQYGRFGGCHEIKFVTSGDTRIGATPRDRWSRWTRCINPKAGNGMPDEATARDGHESVGAHEQESSAVAPLTGRGRASTQTSNMRFRATHRLTDTARSEMSARKSEMADGGETTEPAVASQNPSAGAQRHRATRSAARTTSRRDRPGDGARRSRRWVQLRNATTRTSDALSAATRRDGRDATTDEDTKPDASSPPAVTSAPARHDSFRPDALNVSAQPDQSRVPVGQPSTTERRDDPLAFLWELALLPVRMTMAATGEALKMVTSSSDSDRGP